MDRKKVYFWLMGTCIVLILLAWNVVRLWSTPAAVAMSVVAALIPPIAVIVGNWGFGSLAALPDRLPLLGKRLRTLLGVLGHEHRGHQVVLVGPTLLL